MKPVQPDRRDRRQVAFEPTFPLVFSKGRKEEIKNIIILWMSLYASTGVPAEAPGGRFKP